MPYSGKKECGGRGERVQLLLSDQGLSSSKINPVPNDINAVTPGHRDPEFRVRKAN